MRPKVRRPHTIEDVDRLLTMAGTLWRRGYKQDAGYLIDFASQIYVDEVMD